VTCTVGTLAYGQAATFEILAAAKGSLGSGTNTATVTCATPDPVAGNNSDSVVTLIQGGTGDSGGKQQQ
jgi:hypothetical protein